MWGGGGVMWAVAMVMMVMMVKSLALLGVTLRGDGLY